MNIYNDLWGCSTSKQEAFDHLSNSSSTSVAQLVMSGGVNLYSIGLRMQHMVTVGGFASGGSLIICRKQLNYFLTEISLISLYLLLKVALKQRSHLIHLCSIPWFLAMGYRD